MDYYQDVQAKMGPTGEFYRLFMVPGMLHCAGGPGATSLATLTAITEWVEQKKAPDMLIATRYRANDPAQGVERVRPLCAFPQRAQWSGSGDAPIIRKITAAWRRGQNRAPQLPDWDFVIPASAWLNGMP